MAINELKNIKCKIMNLTPHDLNMYKGDVVSEVIPPSGLARAEEIGTLTEYRNGYPVRVKKYGNIHGLPEPKEGVMYVVSAIVAKAAKDEGRWEDIFVPDDSVRDEKNRIIGARGFAHII